MQSWWGKASSFTHSIPWIDLADFAARISWSTKSSWSKVKIRRIFCESMVNTSPWKCGIQQSEETGKVECCSNFKQVPFSIFQIRTVDPEALNAIGDDISKLLIGPECPEKVKRLVELWSKMKRNAEIVEKLKKVCFLKSFLIEFWWNILTESH